MQGREIPWTFVQAAGELRCWATASRTHLARAVRSDEGHGERRAFFGLGLLERRIDLQRLVDGILLAYEAVA